VRPRCDFIFHLGRVLAIPGALAAAAACGHSLCVPCAKRRGYLRNRMR
jgi:sulfur relay (sulfurtransferase) complex TusBCD TusD component (DsrE family)